MMKHALLAATALGLSSAAYAELNPDPGFDTPGSWMAMGKAPLPTVSSSKAHFTGASKMTLLMISAPGIKRGHKYAVSVTVSNRTAGSVEVVLSKLMMGTATGAAYASPNGLTGETPIADNFTTANGLEAIPDDPPGPKPLSGLTAMSAIRNFCSYSHSNPDDSLVYYNQPGVSHLHGYCGNTRADFSSTFNSLRTKGSTTAANLGQPLAPLNRSAYWFPDMLDDDGHVIVPTGINLYYKEPWPGSTYCKSYPSNLGGCIEMPNGMRYIFGFNFATHSGGPLNAVGGQLYWTNGVCDSSGGPGGRFCSTMNEAIDDAVAHGSRELVVKLLGYNCWNGTQLDTANHRDHVADMAPGSFENYQCPDAFPYRIPEVSLQIYYHIDAKAIAHKWHLSSDEMDGTTAGDTAHMDYREAWSPTVRHQWHLGCIVDNVSCGDGNNGDGTRIKDGGLLTQPIQSGDLETHANTGVPMPYERLEDYGRMKPCSANGTCTREITAASDGAIEIMAWDGFVGDVDDVTVTEVQAGHHG